MKTKKGQLIKEEETRQHQTEHQKGSRIGVFGQANRGYAEQIKNQQSQTKDQYGLSALVYALKGQKPDIVKMIKAAGGNY